MSQNKAQKCRDSSDTRTATSKIYISGPGILNVRSSDLIGSTVVQAQIRTLGRVRSQIIGKRNKLISD